MDVTEKSCQKQATGVTQYSNGAARLTLSGHTGLRPHPQARNRLSTECRGSVPLCTRCYYAGDKDICKYWFTQEF